MRSLGHVCAAFVLVAILGKAQQYTISTFAGGAPPPTSIPALDGVFNNPQGVAVDAAGNVYFSSAGGTGASCIYKIDATGTLIRVAGNGRRGYSGDSGQATQAQLYDPSSVVLDAAGNLYILDSLRIRVVTPDGIITTVAGNGGAHYSGDGGPATNASLGYPQDLAVDGNGNIYVTDWWNSVVRKVDSDGIITTVAGNGSRGFSGDGGPATEAQLNGPWGIAVDAAGNIYVADTLNAKLRKITPDGTITTIADHIGGYYPTALALDSDGNIFATESNLIQEISPDGVVSTYAKTPSSYVGVAVDASGNLLLADPNAAQIVKLSTSGALTVVAKGTNTAPADDGGPATGVLLNQPTALAVDKNSNLFIAETGAGRIRKVSSDGTISTVALTPSPAGVAVDSARNVYFSDQHLNTVSKISSQTGELTLVVGAGAYVGGYCRIHGGNGLAVPGQLCEPSGLAFDSLDRLYIADWANSLIRMLTPDGQLIIVAGSGRRGALADGGAAIAANLERPNAVVVDGSANIYIADTSNWRVRKITPDGLISTFAGSCMRHACTGRSPLGDGGPATGATVRSPAGIAMDGSGNLYLTDASSRVRRVSTDRTINTVAGGGGYGYSGDSGPAVDAGLSPYGMAIDAAGNIYVSDSAAGAVRLLRPVAAVSQIRK